jgi:hypothetical protein
VHLTGHELSSTAFTPASVSPAVSSVERHTRSGPAVTAGQFRSLSRHFSPCASRCRSVCSRSRLTCPRSSAHLRIRWDGGAKLRHGLIRSAWQQRRYSTPAVAPPGFEPGLPDPERRPQGNENRQIDREWRPDEHRRPVGLTSVSAHARRTACKMLAESSGRLSL